MDSKDPWLKNLLSNTIQFPFEFCINNLVKKILMENNTQKRLFKRTRDIKVSHLDRRLCHRHNISPAGRYNPHLPSLLDTRMTIRRSVKFYFILHFSLTLKIINKRL
jgi:hypothetical protein